MCLVWVIGREGKLRGKNMRDFEYYWTVWLGGEKGREDGGPNNNIFT